MFIKVSRYWGLFKVHKLIIDQVIGALWSDIFDPFVTNEFSYPYRFDKSIFFLMGIRSDISLFDEIPVSKQNSPRWDAAIMLSG